MLVDIFSSFDSGNEVIFGWSWLLWVMSPLFLMWGLTGYWWQLGRLNHLMTSVLSFPIELVLRSQGKWLGGFIPFVVSLFYLLIFVNLLGLFPYVFSISSHLVFTLSLAVPLWLSVVFSSLVFNPVQFFSHFCPSGAPLALSPFLVIIEFVSNFVRPITLSVRLTANMSAGHIVLALLGVCFSCVSFMSAISWVVVLLVGLFYVLFEVGVCLIQAYIFSLLTTLYADEHTSSH